jgi:hypothetical protein
MKIEAIFDIFVLISESSKNRISRRGTFELRKKAFDLTKSMNKFAFDTRRVNQETTYNPRRGLQNYHRSEPFVSDHMKKKIAAFSHLAKVLNKIKDDFGRDAPWQDSYARVLQSAIQKGLRIKEADGDFSDAQPSMASLDYLDELMYVRYRLTSEAIMNSSESELRKIVLAKDELLSDGNQSLNNNVYDHIMDKMLNSMATMATQMKSSDDLASKLFGDVKASKDNPEVERTVTIHIKDKVNNIIEKKSSEKEDNIKTAEDDMANEGA